MKPHPESRFFWESALGLRSLRRNSAVTLQAQLREGLVAAILERKIQPGGSLPATRALAGWVGVSRNTVLAVYSTLVEAGYLVSSPRSGHVVNPEVFKDSARAAMPHDSEQSEAPDWSRRIAFPAGGYPQIEKHLDWQDYPYPFVYGQFDASLFPAREWREASQLAVRRMAIRDWAGDGVRADDSLLVEQIQTRLLQRRGISASPDEILVTLGSQQAMFILAALLATAAKCVALEEPGYPDLGNVFRFFSIPTRAICVAEQDLRASADYSGCDYVFISPSHQNPTCRNFPLHDRLRLLERAGSEDFVIVEDDYDSELNYDGEATPSIRALDRSGRVLYVGSLSKTIAPGLRIGYLVAPRVVIEKARVLRRLMVRHPPANNQRAAALFLALGHYDLLLPRLIKAYRERAKVLCESMTQYLPSVKFDMPQGGSALWAQAPAGVDMARVRARALERGVIFDAGSAFFQGSSAPQNYFRMGFSSIEADRIEGGVRIIADCMR